MNLILKPSAAFGPRRILRVASPGLDQRRGNTAGMNPDLLIFSVFNARGEMIGITSGQKLPSPSPLRGTP